MTERNNQNMRRYVTLLTICIMAILVAGGAWANGIGVSPKRVVIKNGQRYADVTLANSSAVSKTFEITTINKSMNKAGRLIDAQSPAPNEFFADALIRYTPRTVQIAPGQSQKVRILSRLSASSADGEYRSHMLFKQVPDAYSDPSTPLLAISIPVILKKGVLTSSFDLSAPQWRAQNEEASVSFDLNRSGNQSIFGNASILVDDKEIARLNDVAVYLSTPARRVSVKIPAEHYKEVKGRRAQIVFTTPSDRKRLSFKVEN